MSLLRKTLLAVAPAVALSLPFAVAVPCRPTTNTTAIGNITIIGNTMSITNTIGIPVLSSSAWCSRSRFIRDL